MQRGMPGQPAQTARQLVLKFQMRITQSIRIGMLKMALERDR